MAQDITSKRSKLEAQIKQEHAKEIKKTCYSSKNSKINVRKIFRRLDVWMIAKKSYIHTPKPQIQSVEPRKGRLGIRTIPSIFGEERKNQEALMYFCWCLEEEKKKQKPCREAR